MEIHLALFFFRVASLHAKSFRQLLPYSFSYVCACMYVGPFLAGNFSFRSFFFFMCSYLLFFIFLLLFYFSFFFFLLSVLSRSVSCDGFLNFVSVLCATPIHNFVPVLFAIVDVTAAGEETSDCYPSRRPAR